MIQTKKEKMKYNTLNDYVSYGIDKAKSVVNFSRLVIGGYFIVDGFIDSFKDPGPSPVLETLLGIGIIYISLKK